MDIKTSLYGLSFEEIQKVVREENVPSYRAGQLADWVFKKHISTWDEARNLPPELCKALEKKFLLSSLELEEVSESADYESRKFLFRTVDQQFIESVLILQQERRTVCVSTQVGCKIGCVFCASGKGKFGRNLTPGEIVEQVAWIEKKIASKITNVVFMGMGEPLDNFEATMKALDILQAKWGFYLGARRITVSTSGITPKILEFVKRSEGRVRLSISLHSSNDKKRSELVPINKKYNLKELTQTLRKIYTELKRDITFEYTLIAGVNDSADEARGVAKIAKPLEAKVNIIPYNPIHGENFKTPSAVQVENFRAILEQNGVRVIVRQTAGRDIDAACGQLRLVREQKASS